MDRILSVVLAVLAVAAVIFLAALSFTIYMGITYRVTLTSTYDYQVSIGNDATLGNVTLFLPLPERLSGNSAVLEGIGGGGLTVPAGWSTTLIGTRKATFLEVKAEEIPASPEGKPSLLSMTTRVKGPIGTGSDGFANLVLAPLAARSPVACTGVAEDGTSPGTSCGIYRGSAYADYTAPQNASLTVVISLAGKNSWDVFGPSSNEYRDRFRVSFFGDERGWKEGEGVLVTGVGDYQTDYWAGWAGEPGDQQEGAGLQVRVTPVAGGSEAA